MEYYLMNKDTKLMKFSTAMMQLFSMYSVLSSRVPNKYRDIYDEYGFPK